MNTTSRRPYRQTARAERTAATRERIVAAARDAFLADWYDDVTLARIAGDAGVSLGTVINHFGGKEGLMEAVTELMGAEVRGRRDVAVPGDVASVIAALAGDYEATGDGVVRALAQEERVPALREPLARGRAEHREWLERVLGPLLTPGDDRIGLLVVATDVFTWKLLRRDQGLSRAATEAAMQRLVEAVLHHPTEGGSP